MFRIANALAWELLASQRWFWLGSVGYLALVALAISFFPPSWRHPNQGVPLIMVPAPFFLIALVTLAHGDRSPLNQTRSGYPGRLFLLPVSSMVLASVPMALGWVVCLVGWLFVASLILRPCRIAVPLYWPGCMAGALLAWLQALIWSPFARYWIRPILVCQAMTLLIFLPTWLYQQDWSDPVLASLLLAIGLVAWPVAVGGVALARISQGWDEAIRAPIRGATETLRDIPPFRTHLGAQLWLEWRLHGFMFVVLLTICFLTALTSMTMFEIVLRDRPWLLVPLGLLPVLDTFGSAWLALSMSLTFPLMVAPCGSGDLGAYSKHRGAGDGRQFLLTRPLSDWDLVQAKVLAAGIISLVTWGCLVLTGLAWAVAGGHYFVMAVRLNAWTGSALLSVLLLGSVLLAGVLVTWLWILQGLWARFLGHSWIPVVLSLGLYGLPLPLLMNWRPAWNDVALLLVAVLLAGKVLLAVGILRQGFSERTLSPGPVGLLVVGWGLLAALLGGLAFVHFGVLLCGTVLVLLPLSTVLLAPLALNWARHA